ncbi:hypothetical protein [Varibaculum sp.]|uniref:hypothetical protein n=1 Tax=Varibaculum sp. TaxID=1895474 RepID=UPI0025CCCC3C|nr:hypothetical protein [Varibaculum sp.]
MSKLTIDEVVRRCLELAEQLAPELADSRLSELRSGIEQARAAFKTADLPRWQVKRLVDTVALAGMLCGKGELAEAAFGLWMKAGQSISQNPASLVLEALPDLGKQVYTEPKKAGVAQLALQPALDPEPLSPQVATPVHPQTVAAAPLPPVPTQPTAPIAPQTGAELAPSYSPTGSIAQEVTSAKWGNSVEESPAEGVQVTPPVQSPQNNSERLPEDTGENQISGMGLAAMVSAAYAAANDSPSPTSSTAPSWRTPSGELSWIPVLNGSDHPLPAAENQQVAAVQSGTLSPVSSPETNPVVKNTSSKEFPARRSLASRRSQPKMQEGNQPAMRPAPPPPQISPASSPPETAAPMKPAVTSPLPANSSSLKMPLTPQISANNPKLAEIGTNSVATPNNLSLPASALATPSPQTAVPAAPNPLPAAPIPSEQNLSKPVDKTRTPASSPIPPSYLAPATLLEAIVPNAPASALPADLGFDAELEVDFDELTSQSPPSPAAVKEIDAATPAKEISAPPIKRSAFAEVEDEMPESLTRHQPPLTLSSLAGSDLRKPAQSVLTPSRVSLSAPAKQREILAEADRQPSTKLITIRVRGYFDYRPRFTRPKKSLDEPAVAGSSASFEKSIISAEGPMPLAFLARRLCQKYRIEYNDQRPDEASRCLSSDLKLVSEPGMRTVWPAEVNPDEWNIALQSPIGLPRKLGSLTLTEVVNALRWQISRTNSMEREETIRLAFELLYGVSPLTEEVLALADRAISYGIGKNLLAAGNGSLWLP